MSRNTGAPESPVQAPSPGVFALGGGIGEPDLQRSGLAGGGQRRGAHGAAGLAVAAHGDAEARDDETVADGDRRAGWRQERRRDLGRRGELEQGDVRGHAMAERRIRVEPGMPRNPRDVLERRLPRGIELDQLVVGARRHAMGGREHEIARQRYPGAERALRAGQHDDRAPGAFGRGRGAADHGRGRERPCKSQGKGGGNTDHGSNGDPSFAAVSRIQKR